MFCKHSRSFALASMFVISAPAVMAMGSSPKVDEEATNARIQPVARVELAPAAAKSSGPRSGADLYKAVCGACHEAGVAGAPKLGDKAAWAPRIALGLDGLLKSAIAGKNAMPPKGGAADASDAEMKAAIAFMANKAGANFK
jgi:cytochrome c5